MPAPEDDLLDIMVLWAKIGEDRNGENLLADPLEVPANYQYTVEDAVGPDGGTIALQARAQVDRRIMEGSVVFLGDLAAWYGVGSGSRADPGLMVVKTYSEVPDTRHVGVARELGLARYRGRP